jgi:hypothetical protein
MTRRAVQELGSRARTPESSRAGEAVGSAEHLHSAFGRAARAADLAVGLWLAHQSHAEVRPERFRSSDLGVGSELQSLRALVWASAGAYARRLRDEGLTPERMLVLVKVAADHPGARGFWARELTNDVVRWSIEAYFDE